MCKEIIWKLILFGLYGINIVLCHWTVEPGSCVIRTRILKHGDTFEPQECNIRICQNGTLGGGHMDPKDCPPLPCDAAVQISVPGRCCKICPGTLARCWFNGMTVEDGETFQLHPCGSCVCQNGKLSCDKSCPDELQLTTTLEGLKFHSGKHV